MHQWIKDGSVDWVVPMLYGHNLVDANLDLAWLIDAAHEADVSVYPMVQPYYHDADREKFVVEHATAQMMRAAVANYWDQGADGMYTWFLKWPLGDTQRRILTEMGDPELVAEGDKHYVVNRETNVSIAAGFETRLPLTIEATDTGTSHPFRFNVSDDIEGHSQRIKQVRLKIYINDIVSEDKLTFLINGKSLANERCLRHFPVGYPPYHGQWLEFDLETIRPHKGWNMLEIILDGRPHDLISPFGRPRRRAYRRVRVVSVDTEAFASVV